MHILWYFHLLQIFPWRMKNTAKRSVIVAYQLFANCCQIVSYASLFPTFDDYFIIVWSDKHSSFFLTIFIICRTYLFPFLISILKWEIILQIKICIFQLFIKYRHQQQHSHMIHGSPSEKQYKFERDTLAIHSIGWNSWAVETVRRDGSTRLGE